MIQRKEDVLCGSFVIASGVGGGGGRFLCTTLGVASQAAAVYNIFRTWP